MLTDFGHGGKGGIEHSHRRIAQHWRPHCAERLANFSNEIVGNAGFFVNNPEDAKELSAAINLALKTDWGDKPRGQAEKFSWDKVTKKYEDLFRSLVK